MLLLFPLLLFCIPPVAPFSDVPDFFNDNLSIRNFQVDTPPATPSQRDVPDPTTPQEMQDRFKEDMLGVLEHQSRAHFDDLAVYIKPNAQLHTCFAPGKILQAWQFQRTLDHLAAFYDTLRNINSTIYSQQSGYVHGSLGYEAVGAHGKNVFGHWAYMASFDKERKLFMIYYIVFTGNCNEIPKIQSSDSDVDQYIERVRVKLANGLFLPDGVPQTVVQFEEFGDFIAETGQFFVCDEPKKNKQEFIRYMADRYHHIRKYKDNHFSIVKNADSFELTFATTWTARNTSQFRDTYVFEVKKMEEFNPVGIREMLSWKIYSVTKKCTQNVTPEPILISGSGQIAEVNKRFTDVIDGQNWDVISAFLDLFDAQNTLWGTCIGSRTQKFDKIRPYLEEVSGRYAKAVVTRIQIRNLTSVDFTSTYFLSRANEVQEQEELDVGFSGQLDPKTGYWRMNRMIFECGESE